MDKHLYTLSLSKSNVGVEAFMRLELAVRLSARIIYNEVL